jgi:glycosyltransferase involved in cell wall biosynthesis
MRIGVNTRFLLSHKMEGFGWYTFEIVKRMVENHPEHEFVFFFDRPFDPKFVFGPNVKTVVLNPPARHPFLFIIYFNWSLTRALKKHQIDVFFSPDGYLSLYTKVPQIAVIHDLNFEHHPHDIPPLPRWYLRQYFPRFAKKAAHILTVSHYSKRDIMETYGITESKISVAWNSASDAYHPLSDPEKSTVKETYTSGKPYFIFVGSLHPRKNLKTLLQAFAEYAQSNETHDLVIVGSTMWKQVQDDYPELEQLKQRIHFTGHVPLKELTQLMGAAFALVYIPYFEGFGIPLVEAMKCHIPIISGNKTSLPEVVEDAGILVDPLDVSAVSSAMHELTTNSLTYEQLAQKSTERALHFSWNTGAKKAMEIILNLYQSRG